MPDAMRNTLHTNQFAERLAALEERIAAACHAAGRAREGVTLVAVSKEHPDAAVRAFYALGVRDFGENKVQAWKARLATCADLEGVRWHVIGPLQTNKAKDVARGRPALVHTIDRTELADALNLRADAAAPIACLVQVNVDAEPQKAGVAPSDLDALVDHLAGLAGVALRGLMTIPRPLEEAGESATRAAFAALRMLSERVADRIGDPITGGPPILSMGMSDDFSLAIAEGATHVRVGTALFGARPPRAHGGHDDARREQTHG